ncbi:MAG: hypothetical protein BVN35_06080 [Proteobacteria bacterium ST_bin11]|nr:MAG: hypothetical protein BVN35_06080 [Proteobacteria bacterium ST_bin11]
MAMLDAASNQDFLAAVANFYARKIQRTLGVYAEIKEQKIDRDGDTCVIDIGNPYYPINSQALSENIRKTTGLETSILIGQSTTIHMKGAHTAYMKNLHILLGLPMLLLQRTLLIISIFLFICAYFAREFLLNK